MSRTVVTEATREIPVLAEADVIVAGGGSAGWAAAIAAAREGASTVLVEQNAYSAGLMCEFGPLGDGKHQIVGGVLHDIICLAHNNIDIHEPTGVGFWHRFLAPGTYYEVPYQSLLPQTLDGLLVTGRCLSATHEALGSARVMCITMPVGEATGVAAAICATRNIQPRALDAQQLRNQLLARGVLLSPV